MKKACADSSIVRGISVSFHAGYISRIRLGLGWINQTAGVNPARRRILVEFVETYMPLNQQEIAEFQQLAATTQDYQEVVKMITTYEQHGIDQGIEQGKRETLILQIEKRFGPIDRQRKDRILPEIDRDKDNSLLLAVLDAASIDELGI